jgi:hypothetical protein
VYDLPEYLKNIHAGPEPEEQCPSLWLFIGLSLRELEKRFIKETLDALAGHRRKTAKILGISERNLRYRLNSEEGAWSSFSKTVLSFCSIRLASFVSKIFDISSIKQGYSLRGTKWIQYLHRHREWIRRSCRGGVR